MVVFLATKKQVNTATNKSKTKSHLTKNQLEWLAAVKRLARRIKTVEKKGVVVDLPIPVMPKRVTKKNIGDINSIRNRQILHSLSDDKAWDEITEILMHKKAETKSAKRKEREKIKRELDRELEQIREDEERDFQSQDLRDRDKLQIDDIDDWSDTDDWYDTDDWSYEPESDNITNTPVSSAQIILQNLLSRLSDGMAQIGMRMGTAFGGNLPVGASSTYDNILSTIQSAMDDADNYEDYAESIVANASILDTLIEKLCSLLYEYCKSELAGGLKRRSHYTERNVTYDELINVSNQIIEALGYSSFSF